MKEPRQPGVKGLIFWTYTCINFMLKIKIKIKLCCVFLWLYSVLGVAGCCFMTATTSRLQRRCSQSSTWNYQRAQYTRYAVTQFIVNKNVNMVILFLKHLSKQWWIQRAFLLCFSNLNTSIYWCYLYIVGRSQWYEGHLPFVHQAESTQLSTAVWEEFGQEVQRDVWTKVRIGIV